MSERRFVGRRSGWWLALLTVETIALGLISILPASHRSERLAAREVQRALVSELGLTDLALWPAATYTRHPSLADRFAPHGDHPAALEHLPAGCFLPPRGADPGGGP